MGMISRLAAAIFLETHWLHKEICNLSVTHLYFNTSVTRSHKHVATLKYYWILILIVVMTKYTTFYVLRKVLDKSLKPHIREDEFLII